MRLSSLKRVIDLIVARSDNGASQAGVAPFMRGHVERRRMKWQNSDRMTPSLSHLHGQTLSDVSFDPDTQQWVFTFTGQRALRVAAPWRLVFEGRIVIGCEDDGHLFGLETPVDAKERVARAVEGQEVTEAAVNNVGDLDLRFRAGSTLQVFNLSCGYEGWPPLSGPGGRYMVAQGGGRVVDSKHES